MKLRTTRNFIVLLFFANTLFAQEKHCDCFLKGRIVDSITNEPIVGALIQIKSLKLIQFSDAKGNYAFDNLCEGSYEVSAQIISHEFLNVIVNLKHNIEIEQNFNLKEEDIHLQKIEIKARRIENLTQNQVVLGEEELFQKSGENFGNTLKSINGISLLQTGSNISKPVIHGLHSNRILILNNGIRQEGQQWGTEHAPEIDPFLAKKITVIKGANGVRYGADAIGGVILVEPNDLEFNKELKLEANQVFQTNGNVIASSIIAEKGIFKNMAIRIQGTNKLGGTISTPNYKLANTGLKEINFSTSVAYRNNRFKSEVFFSQFNTKLGIFSGSHIGNTQDLINTIALKKPLEIFTPNNFTYSIDRPFQDIQHNLLKSKSHYSFKDNRKVYLTLGKQYNFRSEIDVLRGDKNLVQQFKLNTYTGELLFVQKSSKYINGSFGVNYMNQVNVSTGKFNEPIRTTVIIPNYQLSNIGIFVIEKFIKSKLEIETGLRLENRILNVFYLDKSTKDLKTPIRRNTNPSGSLGLNYKLNSKMTINGSFTTAWRAPSVNELFSDGVHHGTASYELGDSTLVPEFAFNRAINLTYSYNKLGIELNLYSNAIQNFIFISPTGRPILSIRGAYPEFRYTQINALMNGFDFKANYNFSRKLNYELKYSYLSAIDKTNNQALIYMPPNKVSNALSYNVNSAIVDQIELEYNWVSRQNKIPRNLIFKDIPNSEIVFNEFAGDFLAPPNAYGLLNFSLSKQIVKDNKPSGFYVNFEAKNILNTVYRDYLNRFRYYADEQGINFIFRLKYSLN